MFCHLSEAVEVQGILLFQELDSNVAVGPDVRLGQVFRPLQKSVVEWDQSVKIVGFAAKFTAEFGFFHCKSNDFVIQSKEINLLNRWPDEDNYDWKYETVYTKSGTELCKWIMFTPEKSVLLYTKVCWRLNRMVSYRQAKTLDREEHRP